MTEIVVTENLLPVLMGNDFLLIRWELMDGFSKFKRHVFRFIVVITEKCCRWKSTSGFDGKSFFAHNLRSNRRIFKIRTAFVQVWLKRLFDIFWYLKSNLVWTEKLKMGARTLFSKIFLFRIERVTASTFIKWTTDMYLQKYSLFQWLTFEVISNTKKL